jgi:hypothetical protein
MQSRDAILEKLVVAFPQTVLVGPATEHECEECGAIRRKLAGTTWDSVPAEFVRQNPDVLPLLSYEAYVALLPAWLLQGVTDPDGEVAGMLLINLADSPDTSGFTAEQAAAIVAAARFMAERNMFGPGDPSNVEALAAVERVWARVAI